MGGHLAALRAYYRRRSRRAFDEEMSEKRTWDEDVVLLWAAVLRIEPLNQVFPVLASDATCPTCTKPTEKAGGDVLYRATFPGGSLKECQGCGTAWLIEHATHSTRTRGPGVVEEPKGGRH
jgi:hypothetical protein